MSERKMDVEDVEHQVSFEVAGIVGEEFNTSTHSLTPTLPLRGRGRPDSLRGPDVEASPDGGKGGGGGLFHSPTGPGKRIQDDRGGEGGGEAIHDLDDGINSSLQANILAEEKGDAASPATVDDQTPTPPPSFDILAITAGEGNGWTFDEATLRASLPLWEGVETFVDHGAWVDPALAPGGMDKLAWGIPRSVRDLGGMCRRPRWDAARGGIVVTLETSGPSGSLVAALAREWLALPEPRPRLGFSADLLFTAERRQVKRILRVLSLDLVFNPARGGAFLRALNQAAAGSYQPYRKERIHMTTAESTQPTAVLPAEPTPVEPPSQPAASPQPGELMRTFEATLCASLLEAQLGAAHLPSRLAESVRRKFAGRIFQPEELAAALGEAREVLAEAQAGTVVQGASTQEAGRISGMVTGEERLQAAVDDLFGAPRQPGMQGVRVERLNSLRSLYTALTGDADLHGGYYPEHVQLATTATMPGLVKNAMNKIIASQWEELGRAGYRWWEKVVRVEHFDSLHPITGVLVGEVGSLPSVAEGAAYTELPITDNPETGSWGKYGGYLPLTLELIDRDQIGKLRAFPVKLANAALRKISYLVAQVFLANGGAGPLMADGKNVFHINHGNLGSNALSSDEWEAVGQAIYNQDLLVAEGETAPKQALDPKYLLVPRKLRLAAMQLLYPQWERQAQIFTENQQRGELGDVIVVPEFTDDDDWAAMCDPLLAPAIYVGERFGIRPEIFISGDPLSPAMFTNDETRLKVRHFVSVFVADYRPMYKENVA